MPVAVVLVIGNEPPMEKANVPADPSAELKICAPLAVLVSETVSGVPGPLIWNVAGALIENACPPSPLTL